MDVIPINNYTPVQSQKALTKQTQVEFESILWAKMLDSLSKTTLREQSNAEHTYSELLNQKYAQQLAKSNPISKAY